MKLRDYILSPQHPRGKHKARVFASALQIGQSDADFLRTELLRAALTGLAFRDETDSYGQRFTLDFECIRDNRSAVVRSSWIVLTGEDFPRLITCFVL